MGVTPANWDDYYHEDYEGSECGFNDPDDYWNQLKPVEEPKE